MSKKKKKIVILTEVELRKTISRLTCEIIEKVKKLDNLVLIGICLLYTSDAADE